VVGRTESALEPGARRGRIDRDDGETDSRLPRFGGGSWCWPGPFGGSARSSAGRRKIRAVLREDHPFIARCRRVNTIHRWLQRRRAHLRASPGGRGRRSPARCGRARQTQRRLDARLQKAGFRTGERHPHPGPLNGCADAYFGVAILEVWHLPQASEAAVRRRFPPFVFAATVCHGALLMDRGAPWVWWWSLRVDPPSACGG